MSNGIHFPNKKFRFMVLRTSCEYFATADIAGICCAERVLERLSRLQPFRCHWMCLDGELIFSSIDISNYYVRYYPFQKNPSISERKLRRMQF